MDYTEYLDYTLKVLNDNYDTGFDLDKIRTEYNKNTDNKIDVNTQKHFVDLYNNKYFVSMGNYKHKNLPDTKLIIDRYGSLSEFLKLVENENKKKYKKENREYTLTKWKYYLFWPMTILSILSTPIAITKTNEIQKNQDIIEELEQKIEYMELEQSKQHILPLNHKNQDSSFQTSSDKENSIRKRN